MSALWFFAMGIKIRASDMKLAPTLVRVTGVEPARLSAREPKSRMSANSIIPAELC